jgi:hypothetical protein
VADLVATEQEHDRHDDAAGLQDARIGLQHLRAVGQQHDHAIADAHAEPAQRVSEAVGGALLLDVGPLVALEGERDVLAPPPHALLAEPGQVHGPRF